VKTSTGVTRRHAREVAFRTIYQADVMAENVDALWVAAREAETLDDDQRGLVDDVVAVLSRRAAEVDDLIRGAARNWELDRLAATDRCVLRLAIAELIGRPGTPARVVIDEAIELARRYGTEESGRFVNGVLDPVLRNLRPAEM
jgi:N utilization substance protein B